METKIARTINDIIPFGKPGNGNVSLSGIGITNPNSRDNIIPGNARPLSCLIISS
jgi:hypothetical protein